MKYQEMKDLIDREIIPQVLKIRDAGQKEYDRNQDNVFANFDRVSDCIKIPREKALMVYLLKHMDSITNYVLEGVEASDESIEGRFHDLRNYALLLHAII